MEADLQRYYGTSLAALGTSALTWRRLRVLLAALPVEAATLQAEHGPAVQWTTAEHLLAHVVDLLAAANWQRSSAGRKPLPARPEPLPRPGADPRPTRSTVTAEALRSWRQRTEQEAT